MIQSAKEKTQRWGMNNRTQAVGAYCLRDGEAPQRAHKHDSRAEYICPAIVASGCVSGTNGMHVT